MTLDLGNIGQTSNRESIELSIQSPCDRFPDTGLSDTWRSDHTDDLSLDSASKFTDGQELQDSVLDILETIMILIEDLDSMSDVKVLSRVNSPRDLGQPIEVIPRHAVEAEGTRSSATAILCRESSHYKTHLNSLAAGSRCISLLISSSKTVLTPSGIASLVAFSLKPSTNLSLPSLSIPSSFLIPLSCSIR